MNVSIITKVEFVPLVNRFHYSKVMPRLNKAFIGGFRGDKLVAGISFGYGVRPLHTIRKLFPSLVAKDYLEIGKMCVDDAEPRNTETNFLSKSIALVRPLFPNVKLIFTWADGFWGKPGYVYQASNFLYGGYTWTDRYIDANGILTHPLGSKKSGGKSSDGRTRPTVAEWEAMGWKHYWGKQFRYCLFLCGHAERKRLLRESTVQWTRDYPKHKDLEWKIAEKGSRVNCERPTFEGRVRFPVSAPNLEIDNAGKLMYNTHLD